MRGEPIYHQEAFIDLFSKLDLDNNDEVTLEEMITFD